MQIRTLFLIAPLAFALQACSSDSNHNFETAEQQVIEETFAAAAPQAAFNPDPTAPVLPFPNSLFFQGSTDGTLNIPVADPTDLSNPQVAINQLDGYSTVAPISTTIAAPLDPSTLIVGDTIRVFDVVVDPATGAVASVNGELTAQQLLPTQVGDQLVLLPIQPLPPSTNFLVILTNGVIGANGEPLEGSIAYRLTRGQNPISQTSPQAALEPLRQLTQTHLAAAASQSIESSNIALSWVFRTQSIREVLQAVDDQSTAQPLVVGPSGLTTAEALPGLSGSADVYIGFLQVPYYQTAVSEENSAVVALNSFWSNADGNVPGAIGPGGAPVFAPIATGTETIPVLMTVPNATSAVGGTAPPGGWPVTIFQHGITGNRTQMLPLADAMANAGRVLVAIDMPVHGLTDASIPLHADNTPAPERERTFGIDVLNNDTNAAGGDGVEDPSGAHFYNLANLANSRDNLRQAVADLMVLSDSLGGATGVALDVSNKSFVGHSLGGIVGTVLLSYDTSFTAGTLAMPGSGIAQLLANSDSFGPVIADGLAGAGIAEGSPEFNQFLAAAQTLVDSGDPINHAPALAANGTAIHLIEVIGDAVIPNSVATAPLSGTEPLAAVLGLTAIDASAAGGALVRFSAGDHGSIISPAASLAATVEMQTQTATFAATMGTQLPVTDTSVIQAVP